MIDNLTPVEREEILCRLDSFMAKASYLSTPEAISRVFDSWSRTKAHR